MHLVDPHTLAISYRLVHLAGMAALLGGALWVTLGALGADGPSAVLVAARRYEWLFWPLLALQVLTGIGNVALSGKGSLGPETAWGGFLLGKLGAVLAVLLLALLRSLVVAHLVDGGPAPLDRTGARRLGGLYLASTLSLATVVLFAVRLAHG
jgi:putative copper export protein